MFRLKDPSDFDRQRGVSVVYTLSALTTPAPKLLPAALPSVMEWVENGYQLDGELLVAPKDWKAISIPSDNGENSDVEMSAQFFKSLPTMTFEQLSPKKKARRI